jgi:hypothetical protein
MTHLKSPQSSPHKLKSIRLYLKFDGTKEILHYMVRILQ